MTAPVINNVFRDSTEHLYAELRLINLYIKKLVLAARTRDALWERKDLRGLYISDREVAHLLGIELYPLSTGLFETSPEAEEVRREIAALHEDNGRKTAGSAAAGVPLRLERLVKVLGLNDFERLTLLLALLPEAAPHSERLFGYIQDDVTRRRPTVALALDAFCSSNAEKLQRRASLLPGSPLIDYRLVQLYDENARKSSPLSGLSLKTDNRIADFLLGLDTIDPALLPWVTLHQPAPPTSDGRLASSLENCLHKEYDRSVIVLSGLSGIDENALLSAAGYILDCPVLAADFSHPGVNEQDTAALTRLLCREALLMGAALFCRHFDSLLSSRGAAQAVAELEACPARLMVSGDSYSTLALPWERRIPVPCHFPLPAYAEREVIWKKQDSPDLQITKGLAGALSNKFRLNNAQIEKAARIARGLSCSKDQDQPGDDNLFEACRLVSATRLMEVARKVTPRYSLPDIVLPPEPAGQLQEILDYVNFRHIVLDTWGFRHKSSLGRGLNALFSGPSGTGKTMAAEIIAGEMGLDLYKIDLSVVVSKYIGETEKNLDRVFREAADSNCVLFFDEADALFGKRSEVKDSHDRYANIEIAYLLQKMEEYEGIVILATNLKKNVDEAFARRMHFTVEFPAPEQEYRLVIWQKSFPPEAPVTDDLDLDFMARQFRLTGGNIKNIALTAAFLAAKKETAIRMQDLIMATRREYQKTGKLVTETDFGRYYALVK